MGQSVVILDVAMVEVTNAIWKQFLRGVATAAEARLALADLHSIPFRIEPAMNHLSQALELSIQFRIAIYDALFVALAIGLNADGITADAPLHAAVSNDYPRIKLLRNLP